MSAEVRKSIRQQIVEAVRDRFTAIRQGGGYATEVGKHCFIWRDLGQGNAPFTSDELADGGAINISDTDREPGDGVLTVHDQVLTIEVVAAASAEVESPPDTLARRIEADLLTAIGVDRQWTINGVALAKDTLPGKSRMGVGQIGDRVAWVQLTFTIQFRTRRFDPYTQ